MMKLKFFSKLLDKRIAAYQRELIETHYKEVDNMYRQMRGWRHDYRGHIQTMKVLAAQGDLDGIKAYLDALDTDLNTVDLAVKTGNAMADAIINSKISLAKSRNIPVQIDAHIPVKLKMSELDLCCILGNLFDNAMDASAELPEEERLIRVYMDMKGTQLYISFTNFTATKKQKKLAGRFVTTKGEGHGASVALTLMLSTMIINRTGEWEMRKMGGLYRRAPILGAFFIAASFAGAGLPGFANFWGELCVLTSLWNFSPVVCALGATGIIISAIYALRAIANIFMGEPSPAIAGKFDSITDMTLREKIPAAILIVSLLVVGFFPKTVSEGLNSYLSNVATYAQTK